MVLHQEKPFNSCSRELCQAQEQQKEVSSAMAGSRLPALSPESWHLEHRAGNSGQ